MGQTRLGSRVMWADQARGVRGNAERLACRGEILPAPPNAYEFGEKKGDGSRTGVTREICGGRKVRENGGDKSEQLGARSDPIWSHRRKRGRDRERRQHAPESPQNSTRSWARGGKP